MLKMLGVTKVQYFLKYRAQENRHNLIKSQIEYLQCVVKQNNISCKRVQPLGK